VCQSSFYVLKHGKFIRYRSLQNVTCFHGDQRLYCTAIPLRVPGVYS
jgi:hypothetical protein